MTALVRVVDDRRGLSLADGHVERLDDELGAEVTRYRPADNAAAPGIEHDRQVEKPGPGRNVGDVRHPEAIWLLDGEFSVDEVRRLLRLGVADGGGAEPTATDPDLRGYPHQPGNPLAADVDALGGQEVDQKKAAEAAAKAKD